MKVAMPLIRRALDLAESNPALFVVIASLSVPLALIYAALSFVTAPAVNLLAFLGLGVLALSYAGWLARLAITHWGSAAVHHC
ncbi:MAG TPA: hypothetical protein VFE23_05685 [Usitatibacter sp.]|jgi:hypothetical protein|nr:hypothetical protein [Usitatibacter sp.]